MNTDSNTMNTINGTNGATVSTPNTPNTPTVRKILNPAAGQGAMGINSTGDGIKLRVAAYCRVSTDMEDQATSFDAQVRFYTNLIQSNPDWEFAGVYADDGITGTSAEVRPEFMRMIEDCGITSNSQNNSHNSHSLMSPISPSISPAVSGVNGVSLDSGSQRSSGSTGYGGYDKLLKKYAKPRLLIFDEWLLLKPSEEEARVILDVLHKRRDNSSAIFCSQYHKNEWYEQLGGDENPLSDAILDRILHDSYEINIVGVDSSRDISMREYYGLKPEERE